MHRYDDSTSGLVALQTIVAVIAALVSLAGAAYSVPGRSDVIGRTQEATDRLDVHASSLTRLTAEVNSLRARILRIERPDQPVYPPRHPGRIGGKPVIPWIEPWSGSRPSLGTEIGSASNPDPSIGSSSPVGTSIDRQ